MIENVQLLIILICMAGEAFFSGMETGVISIHRMRLRHFVRQGARRATILEGFLDDPDRLFGVTLVGTNICVVTISVVAASFAERVIGSWGEAVSTAVMSVLVLLFCEYTPKAWFHSRPLERSRRFAGALRMAEIIIKPLSFAIIGLTHWLVPGSSKAFSKPAPFVTREDLKILAREGEKDGILSPEERVMIHRVFELSGKRARDIMIPRSEITFVNEDTRMRDFFEMVQKTGFSRMPVYDDAKSAFVGVINVFYAFPLDDPDKQEREVSEFLRPPLFIPETMPVDDILPRLRRSHQPMALVRNEKKDVTGLITTEDILEEIVGTL